MSIKSRLRRMARARLVAILRDEAMPPDAAAAAQLADRVSLMELNVKAFGYELARRLAAALPVESKTAPVRARLASKPSTQADLESQWARHWLAELQIPLVFHRKLWELAYVLQAIWEHGHMASGTRGLGFGCGNEPLPSYLASKGVATTVTDLSLEEAQAKGWIDTNQHAAGVEQAFRPHLVERETFDRLVEHRVVDMNAIPESLCGYDFCWSICALEHLGSIEAGIAFVEASLGTVRPGGLSVHTMEYNIDGRGPTVEEGSTVFFQRRHLEELTARLRARGHAVAALDFDAGAQPMDRFIDVPPWTHEMPSDLAGWMGEPLHLKVGVNNHVVTCFGIAVIKAGAVAPSA
jgi:2-polyprenyl-3-methyl-5-hydroxy-6-metoxy-1,4-benzoquinol methylase